MPPKPSPTHFLCLQLANAQLSQSLAAFRADVTSPESFAIPADAIRPPGTLHLTLGVMSLKQEGLISQAVSLLRHLEPRGILSELRRTNPSSAASAASVPHDDGLFISLRGLHSTASASRTSVLYAPPTDADGLLYSFCERLRTPFREARLIVEERPLLLHATVVNTAHVKNAGGRRRKERLMLDARDLLSKYGDYAWAEDMPVTRLALCRMGANKVEGGDDGADAVYAVESEIEI